MRGSALFPTLLGIAALVLSFLCLFAGSKKGFMEDYHIMTLNTSQFGSEYFNTTDTNSSNPFIDFFSDIGNDIQEDINDAINDVAQEIGLRDFYSAHLMDYCYGNYTPSSTTNLTVRASDIHKKVEGCSGTDAFFWFDAQSVLQQSLNSSGVNRTLEEFNWPDEINNGLRAVRIAWRAAFILYCISIGLIGISIITSFLGICLGSGRLSAFVQIMIAGLAFLASAIASALMTAVIVKGVNAINKYGADLTIEAQRGNKFLAITWAATGAMFLSVLVWTFACCVGRRERRTYTKAG